MATQEDTAVRITAAYREGRTAGLAIGALSIAALAYVQLLSLEKSLLAIVLASLVLSRAASGAARTRAWWALGIAMVHVVIWMLAVSVALIRYHDQIVKLAQLWLHHG